MSHQSLIAVYDRVSQVEEAVREMLIAGIEATSISIISQDLKGEAEVHGYIAVGNGAGNVRWLGGLFGYLVGSAFIWHPQAGALIIAGPLAGALLPGIEDALRSTAYEGLLGALLTWGVPQNQLVAYQREITAGHHLVIVHGPMPELDTAGGVLNAGGAVTVKRYANDEKLPAGRSV